jgi:hypothetical protein
MIPSITGCWQDCYKIMNPFSVIKLSSCWLLCVLPLYLLAQTEVRDSTKTYRLTAHRTATPVRLDGVLDEEVWQNSLPAQDFFQKFPFDTSFARIKTEARIAYDKNFIYVSAVCYHTENQGQNQYITTTLRRDFDPQVNDLFAVYFDPFMDQTNGFAFGTTPLGVQREGLIANGGSDGVFAEWDNKWYLETKSYPGKWIAEMAIPYSSLRFKEGSRQWRVQFYRQDLATNEQSTWTRSPRNFGPAVMSFYGELDFEEPLQKTGANISLIPYLAGSAATDWENGQPTTYKTNAGLDAKVAVTSSLNLDLTLNPDFSNVEADVQQANLSRFELFYPERRQFFLENNDLFGQIGYPSVRPFFSRRIGIVLDTALGLYRQTPILFGARLSGKIDRNWRVGLLNMQTRKTDISAAANYTVAVVQRRVFTRSNVSAFWVNKEELGSAKDFSWKSSHFNRTFGIEYGLFSKDNKWSGDFFYHTTYTEGEQEKPERGAAAGFVGYDTPAFGLNLATFYIGENYNAEVGYTPRRGYITHYLNPRWTFFPKNKQVSRIINNHGFGFENELIFNTSSQLRQADKTALGNKLLDRNTVVFYYFNLLNTSSLNLFVFNGYTYLFKRFDPTNTVEADSLKLPAYIGYKSTTAGFEYQSDVRKKFSFSAKAEYGSYFTGTYLSAGVSLVYRWQPFGTFSVVGSVNDISLPQPYASATLLLVGPRVDVSFSKKLFLTSFIQYNNQINNVNINTRLQWRFKPVSDVFFVYTDNYFADAESVRGSDRITRSFNAFNPRNRFFVLKFTYWLNI